MLRLLRLAALLSTVLVLAAACGGGDDDKDGQLDCRGAGVPSGGAAQSAAAPADAASLLSAAQVQSDGCRQDEADPQGDGRRHAQGSACSAPSSAARSSLGRRRGRRDVEGQRPRLEAKAGALNVDARLLSDGTTSWIGLSDTYYVAPAGLLGPGRGQRRGHARPDAAERGAGLAGGLPDRPAGRRQRGRRGRRGQHVTGQLDVAKVNEALQGVAAVVGSRPRRVLGTGSGEGLQLAQDALRTAKADVWIATTRRTSCAWRSTSTSRSRPHRSSRPAWRARRCSSTRRPSRERSAAGEAPADARPAEELQTALLGLLAGSGALGGG